MMKRLIPLVLLICAALPAAAQSDCGNGLPCGSLPWSIPQFGSLRSPTPLSDGFANPVPTATATPTPTTTPYQTATPFIDTVSTIQAQVETIQAIYEATEEVIVNPEGTPVNLDSFDVATQSETFFSYLKGFSGQSFGIFSPLVDFVIFVLIMSLVVLLSRFILPVLGMLVGIVRRAVQLILDFIPG